MLHKDRIRLQIPHPDSVIGPKDHVLIMRMVFIPFSLRGTYQVVVLIAALPQRVLFMDRYCQGNMSVYIIPEYILREYVHADTARILVQETLLGAGNRHLTHRYLPHPPPLTLTSRILPVPSTSNPSYPPPPLIG